MTGAIRKRFRKDGKVSWEYRLDVGRDEAGKRIQVSKAGFETKTKAAAALRDAIAAAGKENGQTERRGSPTLAEFFERWMQEHARRRCAPKTAERYAELGAYAIRAISEVCLDALTPEQLETTFNELLDHGGRRSIAHPNGRPLAARTVLHVAFVVHGCLEKAVRWQMIDRNPMDRVDLPKARRKEIHVLDRDAIAAMLGQAKTRRLYPLLLLAASTGARRGELLALTWPDIDFETGVMSVSKSLEQTKAGLRVKSTKSTKPPAVCRA